MATRLYINKRGVSRRDSRVAAAYRPQDDSPRQRAVCALHMRGDTNRTNHKDRLYSGMPS